MVIGNLDIDWTGCAMGPLKADSPLVDTGVADCPSVLGGQAARSFKLIARG
jgi:hypothetical protein